VIAQLCLSCGCFQGRTAIVLTDVLKICLRSSGSDPGSLRSLEDSVCQRLDIEHPPLGVNVSGGRPGVPVVVFNAQVVPRQSPPDTVVGIARHPSPNSLQTPVCLWSLNMTSYTVHRLSSNSHSEDISSVDGPTSALSTLRIMQTQQRLEVGKLLSRPHVVAQRIASRTALPTISLDHRPSSS
jgi:hypothetical protein